MKEEIVKGGGAMVSENEEKEKRKEERGMELLDDVEGKTTSTLTEPIPESSSKLSAESPTLVSDQETVTSATPTQFTTAPPPPPPSSPNLQTISPISPATSPIDNIQDKMPTTSTTPIE